jgi:hypothetical protein
MESRDKLSEEEFRQMFRLLRRYASTEMDQWDRFKFDTQWGRVFVSISVSGGGYEEAYTDVSDFIGLD